MLNAFQQPRLSKRTNKMSSTTRRVKNRREARYNDRIRTTEGCGREVVTGRRTAITCTDLGQRVKT